MKRPGDYDPYAMGPPKYANSGPQPALGMAIKMLISPKEAMALIGVGGQVHKQIAELSGSKIHISGRHEFYPGTQLQELCIRGQTPEVVSSAVIQIVAKLSEESGRVLGGEWDVEPGGARIHFVVPTMAARNCIGKGGEYIRLIRQVSGMKAHVEDIMVGYGDTSEQVLSLAGPLIGIKQALPLILQKLAECVPLPWFGNWAFAIASANPNAVPLTPKGYGKGKFDGKDGKGKGKDGIPPEALSHFNMDVLSSAISTLPQSLVDPTEMSQKISFGCPASMLSAVINTTPQISTDTGTRIDIVDIEGNMAAKAVMISGNVVGVVAAYLHVAAQMARAQATGAPSGGVSTEAFPFQV